LSLSGIDALVTGSPNGIKYGDLYIELQVDIDIPEPAIPK